MADVGKILVTGATGNVGSLLLPSLTNMGADDAVENITAQPARSYETFASDFGQVFGGVVSQAA